MDDHELQRRLQALDFYDGRIDGDLGPLSMAAIAAFLNNGRVSVPQSWSRARRVLAAKQLVCRVDGIEVGAIDGRLGPQTEYAFAVYAAKHLGAPPPVVPDRDPAARDPQLPPLTSGWPHESQVSEFYGPMGVNQQRLQLPFAMKLAWDPAKIVRSFVVHEKVHDSALRCFERIADAYDEAARERIGIDLFGGCLNVRRKRGGTSWSMHSWGIAIDFDPQRNPLRASRASARLAQPDCETFWRIWEDAGWVSLGRSRDYDWMHVQAARV
jgi:hypothetical protein